MITPATVAISAITGYFENLVSSDKMCLCSHTFTLYAINLLLAIHRYKTTSLL